MSVSVGQPAPAFTLHDTTKAKVSLADYKGKNVVLFFFPLAFSGTCTKEMCALTEDYSNYEKLGVHLLGISIDSLFANGKFKETYNIPFPLLSDFNKEVSTAYDSLFDSFSFDYRGVSKRSTFLIDKEGVVRYMEILPSAGDFPNLEALKAAIAAL